MAQFKQATALLDLEHERDGLSDRLYRLTREPQRDVVEGFQYVAKDGRTGEQRATEKRGQLACDILKSIDAVNARICRAIYPTFAVKPSEGFSDRVMAVLPR
jgi:hypothetical protein